MVEPIGDGGDGSGFAPDYIAPGLTSPRTVPERRTGQDIRRFR
jgi:hypothetical protein